MKNIRYKTILIIILLVLSCLITYWANYNNGLKDAPDPTITDVPGQDNEYNLNISAIPDFSTDPTELKIYTIDPNTNGITPVTALVYNEEITPELITDYVVESMEDSYYFIIIESVTTDGSAVIIDFSDQAPPCQGISPDLENVILDSFAQSLLDNLDDYNKIIYRTNGGNYKSENKKFPMDYVYQNK